MRLTTPRFTPLTDAEMNDEQNEVLAAMRARRDVSNIFRTLARTPKALKGFLAWGEYVLSRRNDLPAREREIVILRIGYLCRSGYEWTQHVRIGKAAGLTDPEIEAIKAGPDAPGWSAADKALLQACDELHHGHFITDPAWAALKDSFSDKQCMDVVFTAGNYTQVCMMLNSFGVQLDAGLTLDPDLKGY